MQLHQLRPAHKSKKSKRVGRGGKHGTYSGRGVKGQKSRSSVRLKPFIREVIKRYPKLRGYRFKTAESNIRIVNLGVLEKKFDPIESVSPESLLKNKIIRKIKGRIPPVKILGDGEIKKKFIITNCLVSKKAKEKIEKAGGKIN